MFYIMLLCLSCLRFQYIQKELPGKVEADSDAFMSLSYSVKVNPKKMKKLEKEYTVIKTKEQGDIAVLRVSHRKSPEHLNRPTRDVVFWY